MLLTLMMNLNMFGGSTPTPTPETEAGASSGIGNGLSRFDEHERRKMIEQDDEDILLILSQLVIKNN